jgi:L,D-peptidoglycan transpeptidase YkuD (ErfK/YbiS/YcfS/YnhG family)
VAGSRLRRAARAARWLVAFVAAAALLGLGTPLLTRSVGVAAVREADGLSPAGSAALASAASSASAFPAAGGLRPDAPRGYAVPAPAPAAVAALGPGPSAATATTPAAPRTQAAPSPAPAGQAATGAALPLPVSVGSSTQVVTVVAPSSRSTAATVTAWQLGPGGWTVAVGPVAARIGSDGVGTASESLNRTPAGTFTLTGGFGRLGNPGTALPYQVINPSDYWVSDAGPRYNQFYECAAACPSAENLWSAGASYNYAVVIDYNRWPAVPGAGSAFFLHVTNGQPTAGCVAIPQGSLVAIMQWLKPAARPLIAIGVG